VKPCDRLVLRGVAADLGQLQQLVEVSLTSSTAVALLGMNLRDRREVEPHCFCIVAPGPRRATPGWTMKK
jgi:hypothetical protein